MKPMKKLISLFLILSLLLCGCSVEIVLPPPETAPSEADTELLVHFIDVGQADCALIEWGDRFVLIDGGNRDDSQLVVSYLQQQNVQQLEAVICSHAHEDHVGGLPAVLAVFPTARVYAPTNTYASRVFDDFLYYTDQQRLSVTIPKPGDQLTLRNGKETLVLTILGPTKTYAETNNTSLVVRLDYGETAFLFTGDMEVLAENDMLDYWAENRDWAATVLKAGHHGSSTSSSYRLLYEVNPEYAVVSVGADNSYGHPHAEIIDRYRDAGIPMLRTDKLGTILAHSDGKTVTFTWENQNAAPEQVSAVQERPGFIGNKNSKTFHAPTCDSLPREANRVYFDSYSDAIGSGYTPCRGCMG